MTDIVEYLAVAEATLSFKRSEIDILREVLEAARKEPDKDYSLAEKRIDGVLAGFAIYGRTPMTDFAWDVYWIAVNPDFQRRGIGLALMESVEEATLRTADRAIFRVETSGTAEYGYVRNFYDRAGYARAGTIPDFYAPGDDFCLYSKDIRKKASRD
jgi:ribosomal protein S18 acetylase RimI-like enzyme